MVGRGNDAISAQHRGGGEPHVWNNKEGEGGVMDSLKKMKEIRLGETSSLYNGGGIALRQGGGMGGAVVLGFDFVREGKGSKLTGMGGKEKKLPFGKGGRVKTKLR